jgi:bacterioferritin-associated ferredoxin
MVVCHCELVNDRTINEILSGAVTTVEEVTERCGAGGRCGGCHDSIERLLVASETRVRVGV